MTRHCKGVNASLLSYKSDYNQLLLKITSTINTHKDFLLKTEEKISKDEQSKKLVQIFNNTSCYERP